MSASLQGACIKEVNKLINETCFDNESVMKKMNQTNGERRDGSDGKAILGRVVMNGLRILSK